MKRYFKLLWKKYTLTFTLILFMCTLVLSLGTKNQMDGFIGGIKEDMARIAISKEQPHKFEEYYQEVYNPFTEEPNEDGTHFKEIDEEKRDDLLSWFHELHNEYIVKYKSKALTEEEIKNYKVEAEKFYGKYTTIDYQRGSVGNISFVPASDEFMSDNDIANRNQVYYQVAQKYDSIYIGETNAFMVLFAMVFMGLIFSVFLTSLDHMTKYKMFDQVIPLDGRVKYIAKLIFGLLWMLIFIIVNAGIAMLMGKVITGSLFQLSSVLQEYSHIGIQGLIVFALITFVGSFTGNIVGHLAAIVPFASGSMFFSFLYPFQDKPIEAILGINTEQFLESIYYPIFSPYSLVFMKLKGTQILVAILCAAVLTVIGAHLFKKAKYEDSGKFFTIKSLNLLFYIFAVWTFASLNALISTGFAGGVITPIVFAISIVFYAYIFRFLFKVRIGF